MERKQCPICSRMITAHTLKEMFVSHIQTHPGISTWAAINHYHDQPVPNKPWNERPGRRPTK